MLNIGSLVVNSLDYIMIVDTNYKIVYNTRYDAMINDASRDYKSSDVLNKFYFDVYPGLDRKESSIRRCLETQNVVIMKEQRYSDYKGIEYVTNNVTLPLKRKGVLVAAVELAMDFEASGDVSLEDNNKRFDEFVQQVKAAAGMITFDSILTKNADMLACIEKCKVMANVNTPTLIYGETGTGKEMFAQAMISYSRMPKNKVVIQNCAAVPENLIESILFGTVKGVFTGAENKRGLFEEADGGIIFLDELNSLPFSVQAKLLRVLQDGTFMPLGSNKTKRVSVKVIGAINIDPIEAIESNILRKDLFYRFSGGLVRLLPLRERKEDIQLYMNYYLDYYSDFYHKNIKGVAKPVQDAFMSYDWEGNVRELKNAMETMIVSAKDNDYLTADYLPLYLHNRIFDKGGPALADVCTELANISKEDVIPYTEMTEKVDRILIKEALDRTRGNKTKASELLGIPRKTLEYKIEKLRLGEKVTIDR